MQWAAPADRVPNAALKDATELFLFSQLQKEGHALVSARVANARLSDHIHRLGLGGGPASQDQLVDPIRRKAGRRPCSGFSDRNLIRAHG